MVLVMAGLLCACTERRQNGLTQKAEEKIQAGAYAEAVDLYHKAIALNPDNKIAIKTLYKLGFAQEIYLKDFEGATFSYQEFIRLNQERVAIYEVLKRVANIYFEQSRDSDKAIAAYKKLIEMDPDSLERDLFEFRIATSFFRANNFDQARQEFQQLVEKFPKSNLIPRARFEIGNAYFMDGKYDVAVEALKQVLRHHPQSEQAVDAQFLIGQCYEHEGKFANALQIFEGLKERYRDPTLVEIRIKELKKRVIGSKSKP